MNLKEMFGKAIWVSAKDIGALDFSVLRSGFTLNEYKTVKVRAVGLGFFRLYINGKCVNPEGFLPLSSDFHKRDVPQGEILYGHRLYVPEFDITDYVSLGDNTIAIHFGGGPGGWGSAIVELPWQFYKHYGETEILEKYYPRMLRYIDYLDAHSTGGLVTSDQSGNWCLGEWCAPTVHTGHRPKNKNQQIIMPPAFVNTYFKVKSLKTIAKIANIIDRPDDAEVLERKADEAVKIIKAVFYDVFGDNYFNNLHGANAFGLDMGLENKKLYDNTVAYYKKLGFLDTGIFGTYIVPRVLFKGGDGELAVELLTSEAEVSYENWRRQGATTFWEYWQNPDNRSHFHPMFGSPVAYFFEYLLGIGQKEDSCGYKSLIIKPVLVSKITRLSGGMEIPAGKVEVAYEKSTAVRNLLLPFQWVLMPNLYAAVLQED